MRDDFGIAAGFEVMPPLLKIVPQFLKIVYFSVEHDLNAIG